MWCNLCGLSWVLNSNQPSTLAWSSFTKEHTRKSTTWGPAAQIWVSFDYGGAGRVDLWPRLPSSDDGFLGTSKVRLTNSSEHVFLSLFFCALLLHDSSSAALCKFHAGLQSTVDMVELTIFSLFLSCFPRRLVHSTLFHSTLLALCTLGSHLYSQPRGPRSVSCRSPWPDLEEMWGWTRKSLQPLML